MALNFMKKPGTPAQPTKSTPPQSLKLLSVKDARRLCQGVHPDGAPRDQGRESEDIPHGSTDPDRRVRPCQLSVTEVLK
jgi:hypothetical protein